MSNSGLPPLTWLRAFEAAARHLSFTQAARELNLTQSAISQHVRSLESFLGRELFIRRTRALMLTEAGANYLPTVREAFDVLARGTRSFIGGDPGQSLMVQCNIGFSVFWLTPRLHRFFAANPSITLTITTSIWDPEREAQNAQVEIRFGREGDMPDTARRLMRSTMYPVCAPGYQDGAFNLESARLFDCSGMMGNWEYWCGANALPFDRMTQINLASTYVIAMNAALYGAGVCMSHDTLCQHLLDKGDLVRPCPQTALLPEGYFLLAPASHDETAASRAFTAWLFAELGI
ncbi:MAG: LysR family transcriptional regulator [Pseudomonadota bacterium]